MRRRAVSLVLLLLLALFASTASGGTLAPGSRYATPYYVVDAGEPGPTAMIVGGMHGNEPAGAAAARQIRHWPLKRGTLIVVPRANVLGLEAGRRRIPPRKEGGEARDLNRLFQSLDEDGLPTHPLARELFALVREHRPDWLLDLHEGFAVHRRNPDSVGSSIIHLDGEAITPHADAMLRAVNATIDEKSRRFVPLRKTGPVRGSLARTAADKLGIRAMIVETTYKGPPRSTRARRHRLMVHTLLRRLEMTAGPPSVLAPLPERRNCEHLHVALYDGDGTTGTAVATTHRRLGHLVGVRVARVGAADVRDGALRGFDAVVFPGGSGSSQARALGTAGRRRVRAFVEAGGGYVGLCAGAYLATADYEWSLKIVDAKAIDTKHWRRGRATLRVASTDFGRAVMDLPDGALEIRYINGPILAPAGRDELPDYRVLARFREEVARNGAPTGVMIGTPALLRGPFGAGRVVVSSPHPEKHEELSGLLESLLRWSAGADRQPAVAAQ